MTPPAEERRRFHGPEARGEAHRPPGAHQHPLREAAVAVPAGEDSALAEVLATAPAEPAATAGAPEPGDARPLANAPPGGLRPRRLHRADDLVAGHHREPAGGEVAARELEVGAAHSAGLDAQQQLVGGGSGIGEFRRCEHGARPRPLEQLRAH